MNILKKNHKTYLKWLIFILIFVNIIAGILFFITPNLLESYLQRQFKNTLIPSTQQIQKNQKSTKLNELKQQHINHNHTIDQRQLLEKENNTETSFYINSSNDDTFELISTSTSSNIYYSTSENSQK